MPELVNLTINGKAIQAEKGALLIEVSRQNGIEIPAFCYYEGLTLQAACRMCLVEVEKTPKLQVGCTLPVAEGMVVMDETTDMVKVALRIMRFYAHESCGWCIPCREGPTWLRKILQRFDDGGGRHDDVALLGELSKNMLGRTFCALGDAAAMPTISIVEKFADDFEKRLTRDREMAAV